MEESKAEPQTHFIENQYVKVFGIIKSLQNQKIVQAFKIIPLKELNEITHHMLECMNASIYLYSKANGDTMDMTVNNHHQTGRDTSTANNYEYGGNNSATPTSTSGLAGLNLIVRIVSIPSFRPFIHSPTHKIRHFIIYFSSWPI
jgi:hypothetical protein